MNDAAALPECIKTFVPDIDARGRCRAPEPGIYDCDFSAYAAIEAINASAIKRGVPNGTPRHMHAELCGTLDRRDTDSMRNGRRLHTIVLEPDTAAQWTVAPKLSCSGWKCLRASTESIIEFAGDRVAEVYDAVGEPPASYKELQAWVPSAFKSAIQITGRELIQQSEYDDLQAQANVLRTHELTGRYLAADGVSEVTIIWDRELRVRDYTTRDGFVTKTLRMKARIDRLVMHGGNVYAVDIKTCEDGGLSAFTRAAVRYRYDIAAAHYREAVRAALGVRNCEPRLLVCERRGGLCTASVKVFGEHWLDAADATRLQVLRNYAACLHVGRMHGHGWVWSADGVGGRYEPEVMEPPAWMVDDMDFADTHEGNE